jgi:hypothetical protein
MEVEKGTGMNGKESVTGKHRAKNREGGEKGSDRKGNRK